MISYNSQTMCEKFSNRVLFYIKKFENSLKLPRVLFSISLIIYTSGPTFLNLSDNLHLFLYNIHGHYIHKLLKLLRLDTNLLSLKTLAMSLFILTLFLDKSSLFINNTKYFRHISYQWLKRTNNIIVFVLKTFLYYK